MRLEDRIDIVTAARVEDELGNETIDWGNPVVVDSLPAHVSYTTVDAPDLAGHARLIEQLRVIIAPYAFDPVEHRIRWQGKLYLNDGPPMVRLRRGVVHHLTIVMKDVQG